jgi:4-hydroxy-tetrahydrodipicolinate synthase
MMNYNRSTGWVREFSGVIAAAVTPFSPDGSLHLPRIPALVDLLVDHGADGIMVGGTTGEFVTMTPDERVGALTTFVKAVNGRVPVVAHVGAADPYTTLMLTKAAARLKVDAVAAMTPQFFPTTDAAIEKYFTEVAQAVPEIPLFVYEFPSRAGNTTSPRLLKRLSKLPNLAGIKVSTAHLKELMAYMECAPDMLVICGNDDLQADFIAGGGRAVVSGNATVFPEVIKAVFRALSNGAEGSSERQILADLGKLSLAGAPDQLKVLLRDRGVDAGVARCRTHIPSDVQATGPLPQNIVALLDDLSGGHS